MSKIGQYIIIMTLCIIMLPLFIVKGCSSSKKEGVIVYPKEIKESIDLQSRGDLSNRNEDRFYISVYIASQDKVEKMDLEEYIEGVVAAEMPAGFEMEALKAQAVAARTYAVRKILYEKKHENAHICTDYKCCQAWISRQDAQERWPAELRYIYWDKIETAVKQTKGIIMTYDKIVINAVFHASSSGRTENCQDVWKGVDEPYLRSVESNGEELCPNYTTEIVISNKEFISKINSLYPDLKLKASDLQKKVRVLEFTQGGRVSKISIDNIVLSGTEFRKLFDLKSSDFKLEFKSDGNIKITCFGNGHGVGMSQWGANYMAKLGNTYEEILRHYYKDIKFDLVNNFLR